MYIHSFVYTAVWQQIKKLCNKGNTEFKGAEIFLYTFLSVMKNLEYTKIIPYTLVISRFCLLITKRETWQYL